MQLTPEGKKSVSEVLNENTFKETLFNSMKHFSISVNLLFLFSAQSYYCFLFYHIILNLPLKCFLKLLTAQALLF